MKLSTDLVQLTLAEFKRNLPIIPTKAGRPILRIGDRTPSTLAARLRIYPLSCAAKRANWVTLRSFTSSGVCFSDSSYWIDGEQFLLPLAPGPNQRHRAIVCSVTHWEAVTAGVFRVSAQFVRFIQLPGTRFKQFRHSILP